ncbi:MAG: hypothetical protein HY746_04200 [Elusimicrobia bacterium]|nr:hypothetical protein [Elusimicrobiota bacterium]
MKSKIIKAVVMVSVAVLLIIVSSKNSNNKSIGTKGGSMPTILVAEQVR